MNKPVVVVFQILALVLSKLYFECVVLLKINRFYQYIHCTTMKYFC